MEEQNVKRFKDFGIKVTSKSFIGDKVKMWSILNKQVTVVDYKIEPSKFNEKGNGKRLHLQLEVDGKQCITFTGSVVLQEMIEQIPKSNFPFSTAIVKEDGRYSFT
jgi:uncharacterized radical SAM superfamily protein